MRILEYGGLDKVNPLDVSASASGSGSTAASGNATTTTPRELIVGAGMTTGVFSGAGGDAKNIAAAAAGANTITVTFSGAVGFPTWVITQPDGDIAEDRTVNATGVNSATAPANGSWVMQMATFR